MVKLQEGSPPKNYYPPKPTHWDMMEEYLEKMRSRTITYGLKTWSRKAYSKDSVSHIKIVVIVINIMLSNKKSDENFLFVSSII